MVRSVSSELVGFDKFDPSLGHEFGAVPLVSPASADRVSVVALGNLRQSDWRCAAVTTGGEYAQRHETRARRWRFAAVDLRSL